MININVYCTIAATNTNTIITITCQYDISVCLLNWYYLLEWAVHSPAACEVIIQDI